MKKAEAAHLFVHGRVQGVFFRDSARKVAQGLGLAGWVRNCSDGSVEIQAEGDRKKLEELIEWCRQGPDLAAVSNIDLNWTKAEGLSSFDIR